MPSLANLIAAEWKVRGISFVRAREIVEEFHYSKGTGNTAVACHGLLSIDAFFDSECVGVALWMPPTKGAALATSENWQGVLALSRLAIKPDAPRNAASFLLGQSMRLLDRLRWPILVTYADTWRGHTGAIYKATNWKYVGMTNPEPTYQLNGRMLSRKAGPKTRTKAEMVALGAEFIGSFAKHKFIHEVKL